MGTVPVVDGVIEPALEKRRAPFASSFRGTRKEG
jgi:hypothetical protein